MGYKSIPLPVRWESWRTKPAFIPWRWYTDKTPVNRPRSSYRALAAKHFERRNLGATGRRHSDALTEIKADKETSPML